MGITFVDALAADTIAVNQGHVIEGLLDDMPDDQAAQLVEALRSDMSAPRIARALRMMGYDVGRGAIYGWRQRNAAS